MPRRRSTCVLVVSLLAAACGVDVSRAPATDQEALRADGPRQVQAGARLLLLQVTSDGHAVYQDGADVYVTALRPGAPRTFLARASLDAPQVYTDHGVVFVWPEAPYAFPQGGTRLVAWTARDGVVELSASSVSASQATAASADGRRVLFIDHVSADGTTGDLVLARADGTGRTVLAAGVSTDYTAACGPSAGFAGGEDPVVAACAPGAGSADLRRGRGGQLQGPPVLAPPLVNASRDGDFLVSTGADFVPVLVDQRGRSTPLAAAPLGRTFLAGDGSILNTTATATDKLLRRLAPGKAPQVVADLGVGSRTFSNHAAPGFFAFADVFTSRAGALVLSGVTDPATGLATVNLVDASRAPSPLVPLETTATCGQSFELFTPDSRRALYYCIDLSTGAASLRSGGLDGVVRTLSTGDASDFQHYGLTGSRVVFADDLLITGPLWLEWAVTLKVADAARDGAPATVVPRAFANYFVTADRRNVVYATDQGPAGAGLYLLPVR